jgi:glutamate/tyrosine decarboxylase-like PLP-dependent enzyme
MPAYNEEQILSWPLFRHLHLGPGIFGEMLSAAFDVKALLWRAAPAAQELEEVVLSWLRQMIGLPEAFSGIIYDTASVSPLHAIAAAREDQPDLHRSHSHALLRIGVILHG